jgi:hypothetical protein
MQTNAKQLFYDLIAIILGVAGITATQFFEPITALGIFIVSAILSVAGIISLTMSVCYQTKVAVSKFKSDKTYLAPYLIHFYGVLSLAAFVILTINLFETSETANITIALTRNATVLVNALSSLVIGHVLIHRQMNQRKL